MEEHTNIYPISLDDGRRIYVQAREILTHKKVGALNHLNVRELSAVISPIARTVYEAIKDAAPTSASVKFGIEIAVEGAGLTAILVNCSGKANIEVTLEWK